jgi:hypothetical protein
VKSINGLNIGGSGGIFMGSVIRGDIVIGFTVITMD